MEYQVTARKWRPQSFEQIVGQESLVRAIKNAISSGKIPHAFLFSGVRGVGKTTTARIIAKALNCKNPVDLEPCNHCPSCEDIISGNSLDVMEIDGASNRGIDNIRQIRDTVGYMPIAGKYKIYIIDEVHMLTNEASNALLKTLEEPPDHVIFILATTEAHKVLPTIKSRCQHYVFKKIPAKTIIQLLKQICDKEKIKYSEEGLYQIATAADGSMRDAESIFDQAVLYSEGNISEDNVANLIGIPDTAYYYRIIEAVQSGDSVEMLRAVNDYINQVGDIKLFIKGFLMFLKTALLVKKLPPDDELIDLTAAKYQKFKSQFESISPEEILRMSNLFVAVYKDMKGDAQERFLLEMTLFQLMDYKNMIPLSVLRNELLQSLGKPQTLQQSVQSATAAPVRVKEAPVSQPATASAYKIPAPQPKKEPVVEPADHSLNGESSAPPDLGQTREALIKVLSGSMIMKPMIQSIKGIKMTPSGINVELTSAHTCEFLSNKKLEIQQGVYQILKTNINIHFEFNHQEYVDGELSQPEEVKPEKKPVLKPVLPKKEDEPPKTAQNTNDNKPIVDTIQDLFDGKIE